MSGLETDGVLPIPKKTTTTKTLSKQTQPQNFKQQQRTCRYCKKPGHNIKECRKCIRKEQKRQSEEEPSERLIAKTYPPCPHYQRTNHTPDMCMNGLRAANRPKLKIIITQLTIVRDQVRPHKLLLLLSIL